MILLLLVAAFAAGWFARGGGDDEEGDAVEEPSAEPAPAAPAPAPARSGAAPATGPRPDPVADAARALALASGAYETAVDRWLDEADAITPAGRAAVGELERAVQRLDVAFARVDELDDPHADPLLDALEALQEAARLLDAFRQGRALDGATSRVLDRVEDTVAEAREAFDPAPA